MALVNYDQSDRSSDESDEGDTEKVTSTSGINNSQFNDSVEDEYKMRIPANAKPIFKPLDIRKRTLLSGKVLLSVPTLEELDSSSGSDEEQVRDFDTQGRNLNNKSFDRTESRSLLDMLPPTRALIVREGDRPMMIPIQVTRPKSTVPFNQTISQKAKNATNSSKITFADDEEFEDAALVEEADLESGSFFSFYDPEKEREKWVFTVSERGQLSTNADHTTEASQKTLSNIDDSVSIQIADHEDEAIQSSALPVLSEKPFADWELPNITTGRAEGTELGERKSAENEEENEPVWTESTFIPGPERKRARLGGYGQPSIGAHVSPVISLLNSSKTAVKEVNQDDLTAGAKLELIKSITSEDHRHRQKGSLVDEPGKLAFRKHQITWLAYKAQDQEYELQEKWAEARRNATQSRAKYGF